MKKSPQLEEKNIEKKEILNKKETPDVRTVNEDIGSTYR
jgi:hypothetical protein